MMGYGERSRWVGRKGRRAGRGGGVTEVSWVLLMLMLVVMEVYYLIND
jgi:hypothetical protein